MWRMIGRIVYFCTKCKQDKLTAFAAQSAYFMVLSAIPFLMVFLGLLQYTPITESMLFSFYDGALPGYISPFLISITHEIYTRSVGIISLSAVAAIWSAAKGIQYITDGLNTIHNLAENRNWFALRLSAAVYTLVLLLAVIVMMLVMVFGNALHDFVVHYVPVFGDITDFLRRFGNLFSMALLIVFFDIIYTAFPNRKLNWKSQLPGAALCAVAWHLFSFGLSIYIDYFNGFSMYGSLTTIVLIMLWLYFCMYILLLCGEVNIVFNKSIQKGLARLSEKKERRKIKKG